jgi:DNA-binding NarL/FixJ family response regulator
MRIVICEDHALLREGITALLRDAGHDVLAHTDDADGLLTLIERHHPELAIVDIRLPPTFRDEGIRAAIAARALQPGLGVLILSQYVEPVYTAELLDSGAGGVGYLLKERVGDVQDFLDAAARVAAGGTALDREVVSELLHTREARGASTAHELDSLSGREREVLALMAEGRSNAAIGRALTIGQGAVEKHISNIFAKLTLPATEDDHRRVLAVVAYLRAQS